MQERRDLLIRCSEGGDWPATAGRSPLAGILPANVWAGEPNDHFFPTRRGEYAIRYNKSNKGEGDGCS